MGVIPLREFRNIMSDNYDSRKQLDKEVDNAARMLGVDNEYDSIPTSRLDKDKFGICHDCMSLMSFTTQYGRTYARCCEFDLSLNSNDPIRKCTAYRKRGEMNLFQMKEMAVLIDAPRRPAGFIIEE